MRGKKDLIVPVRDRRQHKRYLTLRNFRNAVVAFVLVFGFITVRSEMRDPDVHYGRLMQREVARDVDHKPVEVVQEAAMPPVPDETHADPLLLAPAAREQWLHGDPAMPQGVTEMPRAEAAVASGESRIAIVGDSAGVSIVHTERRKPMLSGGFGR
ncbi:MAG: hypothetical protein M3Q69_03760 [Acidobacteriota bacterium]|nr:hypothetical protein [Acidobacteriota bacterium]